MQIDQRIWTAKKGWTPKFRGKSDETVQLVFVFGPVSSLNEDTLFQTIRSYYPKAHIFGCSTAGEIHGTQVTDNSIVSTAVSFQFTRIKGEQVKLSESMDSFRAGEKLAKLLSEDGLAHIFVLSDGTNVNGSELVKGLSLNLPEGIGVTGGLAGDGEHFQDTMTFWDGLPEKNSITAVGFYGDRLKVGYGSLGGWDPFGPERIITRSNRNVLYELDGQSALELYKKYLGEHANGLPATGLLFPLSLRDKEGQSGVVRTILAINEKDQSMTFAGDMPQGAYARLMKANFDRLIDGAIGAAKTSYEAIGSFTPELAILISCVGRKMVLKQRTEEEVEGVREILGNSTVLAGFYSYGEICPFTPDTKCELHNQTMTITVLAEK